MSDDAPKQLFNSAGAAIELLMELPEPVVVADSQDRVIFANKAAGRLAEVDPAELIGQPVTVFRAGAQAIGGPLKQSGTDHQGTMEFPVKTEDGRLLMLKIYRLHLGQSDLKVGLACDVTGLWETYTVLETVQKIATDAAAAASMDGMVRVLSEKLTALLNLSAVHLVVTEGRVVRIVRVVSWTAGGSVSKRETDSLLPEALETAVASNQPTAFTAVDATSWKFEWLAALGPVIAVPLAYGTRHVGVLLLVCEKESGPVWPRLDLLRYLSQPLGISLVHGLIRVKLQQKLQQQQVLLNLVGSVSRAVPSAELLETVMEKLAELYSTPAAAVAISDPASNRFKVVAAMGGLSEYLGREFALGSELRTQVVLRRELLFLHSLEQVFHGQPGPAARPLRLAVLPVSSDGLLLGVLLVALKGGIASRGEDLKLLQAVADVLGSSLPFLPRTRC